MNELPHLLSIQALSVIDKRLVKHLLIPGLTKLTASYLKVDVIEWLDVITKDTLVFLTEFKGEALPRSLPFKLHSARFNKNKEIFPLYYRRIALGQLQDRLQSCINTSRAKPFEIHFTCFIGGYLDGYKFEAGEVYSAEEFRFLRGETGMVVLENRASKIRFEALGSFVDSPDPEDYDDEEETDFSFMFQID